MPWRQPGDWALNYPIAYTAHSHPVPDFLASAIAPEAEVRAWVWISSRAGPVVRGRTFAQVSGPAGELWQQEVRVAFGRLESVWRAASLQQLGQSKESGLLRLDVALRDGLDTRRQARAGPAIRARGTNGL